jgi:hypothetical protein
VRRPAVGPAFCSYVKSGGHFVLYASANKTTYALNNQEKSAEFAGQKSRSMEREREARAGIRLKRGAIWSPPIFSASER